ncbi:MAG TPA: NAD(P)-binding domain-containing protein [Anaerolineales bacterium]
MQLGFAGLGAMGSGIVSGLLAAGRTVSGWNRTTGIHRTARLVGTFTGIL